MTDLEDARRAVHDAVPAGWVVNRWHIEYDRWHVLAADHRPGRKRPDSVESVGMGAARQDG